MKKNIFIFIVFFTFLSLSAKEKINQNIEQNAFVYSLPRTELCIEIELEKITSKTGIYNQYAQRYLATDNVILEDKVLFNIKAVQIKPRAIVDPARTYMLPFNTLYLNQINVDPKGILSGINVKPNFTNDKAPLIPFNINDKNEEISLLPLGEEYMMAGSNAKLAEGVAKLIYRLRESRVSLLTGDLEHLPSDGKSLSEMLSGIDKMEKELTELFIGKTDIQKVKHSIHFTPDSITKNQILFRLSVVKGIVASSDLSGKPYYINLNVEKPIITTSDYSSKSNKLPSVNTILPAHTIISITDGIRTLYSTSLQIPQFGTVIPLTLEELVKTNSRVQIDTNTGRILSIEKPSNIKSK